MGEPLPEILRTGVLIRVAGGPDAPAGTRTQALTFVDLRFGDRHVERRLGPGAVGRVPEGHEQPRTLQTWGEEVFEDQVAHLLEELGADHDGVDPASLGELSVEVVVEWNHDFTWLEAAFRRHSFPKRAAAAVGPRLTVRRARRPPGPRAP